MHSVSRSIGTDTISIETGKLALQAHGAVVVRQGDSMVLVTATMAKPREGIDSVSYTHLTLPTILRV